MVIRGPRARKRFYPEMIDRRVTTLLKVETRNGDESLPRGEGQAVGGGGIDCGVAERQREGGAEIPGRPLIHEPGTQRVRGLAEDKVERAVVEVGEVGGEAL